MTPYEQLSPLAQKALRAFRNLDTLSAGKADMVQELVEGGWCRLEDDKLILTPEGRQMVGWGLPDPLL